MSDSEDGGPARQPSANANTKSAHKRAKRRKRARARKSGKRVGTDASVSKGGLQAGPKTQAQADSDGCSPGGERKQKTKRRRNRRHGGVGASGARPLSVAGKEAAGTVAGGGAAAGIVTRVAAGGSTNGQSTRAGDCGPRRDRPVVAADARRRESPHRSGLQKEWHSNVGGAEASVRPAAGEVRLARAERNPRAGGYRGILYAALDLGTNNCRLLVAKPEGRAFRVVDAYSRIVRLGEGIGASHRLSDAAMERAVEALAVCRDKLVQCGSPVRMRLIATEACRAAENGPLFIERVRKETGLSLEIVTRETEARLAVAGCTSLVAPDADGVVLFDIGGGSSELVWLDLRNRCGARGLALTRFIRHWTSLPLGVVTLAERHGGTQVGPECFEAMVEDVSQHLTSFTMGSMLSEAISSGDVHMLGTSGTVTTLAGVHLGLERYDRRRVDGAWLADADVSAMIARLLAMPYEERVDNPCIGADRADLVLAGCAILEAIRRRWPCKRLRVADRGLREGILMELMAADRKGRTSGRSRH
ncbi:Ppx/GppA phosphatase [Breoghania corrubedonensis]|uniref:Ppx/GppA phosphatase n=1 Tax=Breoghania corrubedonensis TaxID=665038 RepID=A0A2T5V9T9_9HYPH|nr:Ppx/GppA phosphatase [Breoghania corrubedonensis]